jgi:glycosyltransferase involved in cell wall biosynthesis
MQGKFVFKLKCYLKNYRLGMLVSEIENFVLNTPTEINQLERRFTSVKPRKPIRGNVLLSYVNKPFFLKPGDAIPNDHSNYWESRQIAKTFLDLGYRVDVIGQNNDQFLPSKNYSFFIGTRINFGRIAPLLNGDCVKILHIDSAHWLFHNSAEYRRLRALQERKGFVLSPQRYMQPNLAIERADCATALGNEFTIGTYSYAKKPLYRVPISSPVVYPWPKDKDFEVIRKRFLWFGSGGFVHKGLDLVLDAFAEMPDYHLTVCGPIDKDSEGDFRIAYHKELYQTANIQTLGWVNVTSEKFLEITNNCLAVIYPSCSEGQSGGVVTCLHAGLIPIVSRESGVDVGSEFGAILEDSSVEKIKETVRKISNLPSKQLEQMARKAWEFARGNHTRESFAREYSRVVSDIISATVNEGRIRLTQTPNALNGHTTKSHCADSAAHVAASK